MTASHALPVRDMLLPEKKASAFGLLALLAALLLTAAAVVRPQGAGGVALFILLNAMAAATAGILAGLIDPSLSKTEKFIAVFVVWAALVAGVELLLGTLKVLNLVNVLSLHGLLLAVAVVLKKIYRKRAAAIEACPDDRSLRLPGSRLALIVTLVVCALLARQSIFALIQPPTWWDTLAHHLPVPANWLQTESLKDNPAFGLYTYPYNSELFYLWFMLPFHGELAVNFVQLIFLTLLVASVLSIGMQLGLSLNALVIASAVFLLSPVFLEQTVICYNEIINVALFTATLAFWLRYNKRGRTQDVLFGAVPFALFFGSDFVGLLLAPIAIGFLLLAMVRRRTPLRQIARNISLVSLVTLLLGSFWYIRNFLTRANPFYPIAVSIFGRNVFPGPQGLNQLNMMEYDSFAFSMLTTAGMLFGVLLAASLMFLAIALMRAKNWQHAALLAIAVLMIAGWYFLLPVREIRYLMFIPPLGAIALGCLIDKSSAGERRALLAIAFAFMIVQTALWVPNYWYALWVVAGILVLLKEKLSICFSRLYGRLAEIPTSIKLVGALALLCIGILLMPRLHAYRKSIRYSEHYKGNVGAAWEWIEQNTEDARIAYTGTNKPYPLFGPGLTNHVTYIRTGLPAYLTPVENERYYVGWRRRIAEAGIDYLFVCKMDLSTYMEFGIPYPIEKGWSDSHPELFKRVFRNDYVTIYEIEKSIEVASRRKQQAPGRSEAVPLTRDEEN